MDTRYATIAAPATADYVLAVLQDQHRQQCEYDPEAVPLELSFASTIDDWRDACDLLAWRQLGRALNIDWSIRLTDGQWKQVLEPSSTKRLAGVCELIAKHAARETIQSSRLLGAKCLEGGAFRSVRSMLAEAGAAAESIRPSTPLQEFTRTHAALFLNRVRRLAPGALPLVRFETPLYDLGLKIGCLGAGLIAISALAAAVLSFMGVALALLGGVLLVASIAITRYAVRRPPKSVSLGGLRTFGELARAIASKASSP